MDISVGDDDDGGWTFYKVTLTFGHCIVFCMLGRNVLGDGEWRKSIDGASPP